ncbi:MAG: tRNA 2-thiouridine(34) synthase MnmA [Opitutae bacterium]|nr:tRNA 2-thiouridine(34) synthase MnmA [Opitutae bacterium]|tara:strand:- start:58 stop:1185 length:1128 start_codon:yes stop_codon:yes gene_type:complete
MSEKVLVALSGGVDSAVSAALLIENGYDVSGVYVRTWEYEDDLLGDCPGAQDLKDAKLVARTLGISFSVVNFIDFYQQNVVMPMVQGYKAGITPNPDILCNRVMKFGALLEYADENGYDCLATGHYCLRKKTSGTKAELWEGSDKNKDQSYFLAKISQEQLEKARFPLGEIEKKEVRNLARRYNLPVADKKDSQGICFLGKVKISDFLSNFLEDQPGDIVTSEGHLVGRHSGLHKFTLGQRRGIGVPSNQDYENFVVTGKNQKENQLIVAFESPNEPTLWGYQYEVDSLSFLSELPMNETREILGKARYRDPSVQIQFKRLKSDTAEVIFEKSQRALTPGQVLAFYEGERLLGGGTYSPSALGRADQSYALDNSA